MRLDAYEKLCYYDSYNLKYFIPMYVRKRKNESGSYSVMLCVGERLPGKKNSITKMIKSFGSANDEEHLNRLLLEAESYKKHLETTSKISKPLRINSDRDIHSCHSYNIGFSDIYGNVFSNIFKSIKLKEKALNKLKDLVVMRIANPSSKLKTAALSTEYGFNLKVDTIYKLMDLVTTQVITETKKIIYEHTKSLLSKEKQTVDILFYDLTTIYFETNVQNDLRDFGFSKDGKHQHVQIVLAIIVTKEGLPIDYEEFPGNTYEGHTLLPVLNKIKERYCIDKAVLVADAALMNKINLQELDKCGIEYIIAARLKNANKEVKKIVFDLDNYQTISSTTNVEEGINERICTKTINCDEGDSIIAYHSTKRARKDAYDREQDLEKIKKHLNSTAKSKLTGSLKKSYVKIHKDCKIEIDLEKLKLEEQYDGFFGLRTNIKNANPSEILTHYRGLWQVEQTFRITKSNLEIRPVFHYTPRRIRAHFLICYIALTLIRHVEFTLKINNIDLSTDQLLMLLNRMRKIQLVNSDKHLFELLEDPPKELIPIYQVLKIKPHKKFQYIPNL